MNHNEQPLVSIVTPFYNTDRYLAECIESVLSQSYQNWEYILVNNCSTDRSFEIANSYALSDSRILIHTNKLFLTQVQNYNHALLLISPESKYCKIVQADDWIFPECIKEMVRIAEKNPTAGIVGSYRLRDTTLDGGGLPYSNTFMSGFDICRWHLLNHPENYIFGTPTTLLFRSNLVRAKDPFYDESSLFEDYEVCYELLKNNDFGFVHQLLTYERVDTGSLSGQICNFYPYYLHAFICLKKYGQLYLTEDEYSNRLEMISQRYFRILAKGLLYERDKEFWAYHKFGLQSIGFEFSQINWSMQVLREFLDIFRNPKTAALRLVKILQKAGSRIADYLGVFLW